MLTTVQTYTLILPEFKQLLEAQDLDTLKNVLKEINPVDLAEGWRSFTREEQMTLFQLLGTRRAIVVFEELDVEDQVFLLEAIGAQATGQMVRELPPGEVAHLFRKLPRRVIRHLRNVVKRQETAERLTRALEYAEDSAGSLMHTGVINLREFMTASQALNQIRAQARTRSREPELLSNLYVVDGQDRLVGYVRLQSLVAASHASRVKELMESSQAVSISAEMDQEEAARLFSKYNLVSAPVVDDSNRLVGVLLVDDVLEIISEEAEEDMAKMAGASPDLLNSHSVWKSTSLRVPWLLITFVGQLLVAAVIGRFESTLSQVIAMVSFMPLIAALGGSIGSQSVTIIVRGLATGELQEGAVLRRIGREWMTGLLCGLLYGVVLGGIAYISYGDRFHLAFAVSVGLAVLVSMTIAATTGTVVPLIFQRIGVDPAAASAPLISTTTDLLSVASYFLLATALLQYMV